MAELMTRSGGWSKGRLHPEIPHLIRSSSGYILIGLSGFALLASGPRLLGEAEFSVLAIAWTLMMLFGAGVALPGEQAVTRAVTSFGSSAPFATVEHRLLLGAGVTLILPVASAMGADPLLGNSILWSTSVVLGCFAWALNAAPRGFAAGTGRFALLAGQMSAEALVRIGLCAIAWLWPAGASVLLAAAVGLPLIASAVVGRFPLWHARGRQTPVAGSELRGQGGLTALAISVQFVINAAAIFIAGANPGQPIAGAYVAALTYFRIPFLLLGGLLTMTLSRAGSAHHRRSWSELRRISLLAPLAGVGIAAALSTGLLLASAWLLPLYYGNSLPIPTEVLALMAASTVLTTAALQLSQVLSGCQRYSWGGLSWFLGAAATAVLMVVAAGAILGSTLATIGGLAAAVTAIAIFLRVDSRNWRA